LAVLMERSTARCFHAGSTSLGLLTCVPFRDRVETAWLNCTGEGERHLVSRVHLTIAFWDHHLPSMRMIFSAVTRHRGDTIIWLDEPAAVGRE
jgi:hypothetical protein